MWKAIKAALSGPNNEDEGAQDDPQQAQLQRILAGMIDPKTGADITQSGVLSPPMVQDGRAYLTLTVSASDVDTYRPVRDALEVMLLGLPFIDQAFVVLSSEGTAGATPQPQTAPQPQPVPAPAAAKPRDTGRRVGGIDFSGIGAIIAVASGKGGVGKSTTTANLAVALAAEGLNIGVLDADVYGPSIPRLFGISSPPVFNDEKRAVPPVGHGIKVMSMGFLIEEGTPMVWRAPMVVSALTQMLSDVVWAPIDVLLIDMPPGTGDTQLTISQQVPLDGAVIVSTPQDLALIDARKGVSMFEKVQVPILGIVENMSTYICPQCGHEAHIFGHGGAQADAAKFGVPFLGEIPLHIDIRETSDAGEPVGVAQPDGPHAKAYRAIAAHVWADVTARKQGKRQPPEIVIEDDLSAA